MIICIGPVCIPLWGLFPFLLVLLTKLWNKIKGWLGYETAEEPKEEGKQQEEPRSADAPELQHKVVPDTESSDAASSPTSQSTGLRARKPDKYKHVIEIESTEHFQTLMNEAIDKDWTLVTKFTASWCKPCKAIQPHYQQLASRLPGIFVQVDVDEVDELADRYRVSALPTFLVVRNRKRLFSDVVCSQDALTEVLEKHCT